jgi:repressor LexA
MPVIAQVAAGHPVSMGMHPEYERLALPTELVGTGELFILEVQTDAMSLDGIVGGDLIVVREQSFAESGDLVAVVLADEDSGDSHVLVRYLEERTNGRIRLRGAGPSFPPVTYSDANTRVLGVVVALLRRHHPSSPHGGSPSAPAEP